MEQQTKTQIKQQTKNETALLRTMGEVVREAGNGENAERRRILSFSSEQPYQRWFGMEILDHSPGAVNLARLNSIGVLLFNHDTDRVLGKVLRAWVDERRRGMVEVEFDTDEEAERIFAKVNSGTLKATSVRYQVDSWEEVKAGAASADGRYTGPCQVARRWTPTEVSIVSIPADATVGVGRAASAQENEIKLPETQLPELKEAEKAMNPEEKKQEEKNQEQTKQEDLRGLTDEAVKAERRRINDVMSLCREVGMDAQSYIENGAPLDSVRQAALDFLIKRGEPVPMQGQRDEEADFCRAAAESMLLRAGVACVKPTEANEQLRNLSMRDLLIECMARSGEGTVNGLLRRSKDDLWQEAVRQFMQPTAAFPAILDNAINKTIVHKYQETPASFELWTTRGSLSDFKPSKAHEYAIGGGDFQKVSEGGELKASTLQTEKLPSRQLGTYGASFTMTREAFINDDIGFLTEMPGRYAKVAKRKINQQVYELIFKNPKIYDSKNLFCADHSNVIAGGCAPSIEAVQKMMLLLMRQKDHFGESIMVQPRNIILPVGYAFTMAQILESPTVNTTDNTQAVNALYKYRNQLSVVEDGALNVLANGAAAPWFMAGDPDTAGGIQVDYLNGKDSPNFRRSEQAGRLGFVWDIFMDWGVTVTDFRGLAKNPGVVIN